jgi:glutathione S-transferase
MLLFTAWITLAALLMYCWIFINVGRARATYAVQAPSCDGPPAFQSVLRVQANTVEQMALFLPLLWICAYSWSDRWAAAGGALWVAGRIIYALGYYQAPKKRSAGFMIASLATLYLLLASIISLALRSGLSG